MIKHAFGNIFDSTADAILHQVNCQGVMGAGIAKQVRNKFPDVYQNYKELCDKHRTCPSTLLGTAQVCAKENRQSDIVNLFAQNRYGRDKKRYTDYAALRKCLTYVNHTYAGKSVAVPYLIGCGFGGGDWNIVLQIIEDTLKDCDVTIYTYLTNSSANTHRTTHA